MFLSITFQTFIIIFDVITITSSIYNHKNKTVSRPVITAILKPVYGYGIKLQQDENKVEFLTFYFLTKAMHKIILD